MRQFWGFLLSLIFNEIYYFRFAIPVYHRQMSIPRKPFPTKLIQLSTPSMATLTHGGNLRLFLVDVNTTESPCPLISNRYTYFAFSIHSILAQNRGFLCSSRPFPLVQQKPVFLPKSRFLYFV